MPDRERVEEGGASGLGFVIVVVILIVIVIVIDIALQPELAFCLGS